MTAEVLNSQSRTVKNLFDSVKDQVSKPYGELKETFAAFDEISKVLSDEIFQFELSAEQYESVSKLLFESFDAVHQLFPAQKLVPIFILLQNFVILAQQKAIIGKLKPEHTGDVQGTTSAQVRGVTGIEE